jgi:ligand-binding sensor domain-containing protein
MHKSIIVAVAIVALAFTSCNGQNKSSLPKVSGTESTLISSDKKLRFEHGVRSILEDSKGNFWFGSWQEGVARFDGEQLTYFTKADGLDRNQVRKVFEDRSGTIWFDTGDGICSYDGKRIITHTNRDYSSKDDWKLGAGDLWFGEDDGRVKNKLEGQPGVYRYDGEKLTFLTFPLPKDRDTDWHYKCTGIARGKDGRIWFATYGSVIGYDGKSFTFMNNQSGGFDGKASTDLHVRSIFEDSKGRLWIGNNGIGVLLHEGGKTINFTQKNGLGSRENRKGGPLPGDAKDGSPSLDRVFTIGEDAAGNIWFGLQGTQGYGAWRYDGKSLRHFTEKDGLTSKHISVIYRDKRGDLWLGGDGVFKFNGKSFDRIH